MYLNCPNVYVVAAPGQPEAPIIKQVKSAQRAGKVDMVDWKPPFDGGAPILEYQLISW